MYLSEFCDVEYNEKHSVVLVTWKKFCCGEDYRRPLLHSLEIMREHSGCDYVADTRHGFEDAPEDTAWVVDYFMPEAVKAGCKCIWFIIDEANSLKDELEGQASDSGDIIRFRYIYSLDEIGVE